jgi:hypothetical protein
MRKILVGAALRKQRVRGTHDVIYGDAVDCACGRMRVGKMRIVQERFRKKEPLACPGQG